MPGIAGSDSTKGIEAEIAMARTKKVGVVVDGKVLRSFVVEFDFGKVCSTG